MKNFESTICYHRTYSIRRIIISVFMIFCLGLLQGCEWDSDREFIPASAASDPFSGHRNMLIDLGGRDVLLLSRAGVEDNDFIFSNLSDGTAVVMRFFDITPTWKVLGEKEYIGGIKDTRDNKSTWAYFILSKKGDSYTGKVPDERKHVDSLRQIIDSKNSSKLISHRVTLEFITTAQATILKGQYKK